MCIDQKQAVEATEIAVLVVVFASSLLTIVHVNPIIAKCYHGLCDEYRDDWDLTGAVEDMQLFFEIGAELSQPNVWPKWAKSSEFSR